MTTVVRGPRPPELEAIIERRRRLGQDLFDEVWEGVYHMAPGPSGDHAMADNEVAFALTLFARRVRLFATGPFNLGSADDYRVPDRGVHRQPLKSTWVETAALVAEIVSPQDESWAKLDFYAKADVEELVMVDPAAKAVTWLGRHGSTWDPIERSEVLKAAVVDITDEITFL